MGRTPVSLYGHRPVFANGESGFVEQGPQISDMRSEGLALSARGPEPSNPARHKIESFVFLSPD